MIDQAGIRAYPSVMIRRVVLLMVSVLFFAACTTAESPRITATAPPPAVTAPTDTALSLPATGASPTKAVPAPTPTRIPAPTPTPVPTPTPSGPSCGLERWSVKTLADQDAGRVDFHPRQTDILQLRELQAPANLPKDRRVSPTELETYVIQAQVQRFKLEHDSDIHVVISPIDRPSETMIVELVDVGCTKAGQSSQREAMLSARQSFVAVCGQPSSRFRTCLARVEITGVGFFDFLHGQTGVAPNGIELHPVLAIKDLGR